MREAMRGFDGTFHHQQLAAALDLVFDRDKGPMYRALDDFRRRGEVRRLAPGVYRYVHDRAAADRTTAQQRIWKAIRAARSFTLDELARLSGAGRSYCKEYVDALQRNGAVKNTAGKGQAGYYRLVADPGPVVPGSDNAARLRALRQKRREALAAVTAAQLALVKAKEALEEEDEGQ
jgi:hypothetical protein